MAADRKNYAFVDELIPETKDLKVLRDQCLNIFFLPDEVRLLVVYPGHFVYWLDIRGSQIACDLRSKRSSISVQNAPEPNQARQDNLKKTTYLNLVIKEVYHTDRSESMRSDLIYS
ncbi:hypothetical protein K469DRAFT_692313 [Zopfia rhizophila CBS 207.26]|uniref:Uncharacterized protein n=1 Tax=Zopfia rhizophila CBS 207.26 TaxID=1314779 RepID=A0A6A6DTS2_9PEZI|nr:hypothetical protein K469DRAFT_692313 [Zopfia rhizophila CBS 207.26]